jgi:hypothetical protein
MVELAVAADGNRDEEEGVQGRDLARGWSRATDERRGSGHQRRRWVEEGEGLKLQKWDELELVAMADRFVQQGDRNTTRTRRQRRGKNGGLTRKSWVWSERAGRCQKVTGTRLLEVEDGARGIDFVNVLG